MDGLPLTEDTGLEFASEQRRPGCMPAATTRTWRCCSAPPVSPSRAGVVWPGRVLLMFQPGEEGFHGPGSCSRKGCSTDRAASDQRRARAPHHDALRSGTIEVRPGPMLASSDTLRITVRGRGGHASTPHTAVDPIAVAAEIVLALQSMVTRRVDAFDPAVVTIAQVVAGTTTNIIPETAFLGGTMRTVSEARRTGSEPMSGGSARGSQPPTAPRSRWTSSRATRSRSTTTPSLSSSCRWRRGGRAGERAQAPGSGHGRRGLLVRPPAGPRRDGLRRRAAARCRPSHGPDEPLEPGGLRRVGDGRRDRTYVGVARRFLSGDKGGSASDRRSGKPISVSRRSAANRRRPISCTSRPISLPRADGDALEIDRDMAAAIGPRGHAVVDLGSRREVDGFDQPELDMAGFRPVVVLMGPDPAEQIESLGQSAQVSPSSWSS